MNKSICRSDCLLVFWKFISLSSFWLWIVFSLFILDGFNTVIGVGFLCGVCGLSKKAISVEMCFVYAGFVFC